MTREQKMQARMQAAFHTVATVSAIPGPVDWYSIASRFVLDQVAALPDQDDVVAMVAPVPLPSIDAYTQFQQQFMLQQQQAQFQQERLMEMQRGQRDDRDHDHDHDDHDHDHDHGRDGH